MKVIFESNKTIVVLYLLGFLLFVLAGGQMLRVQFDWVEDDLKGIYLVFDFAIAGTLFMLVAFAMCLREMCRHKG